MNIYSDYPHIGKERAKQKKGEERRRTQKYLSILTSNKTENEGKRKCKEMNGYTIPPHAKQYIESKGKRGEQIYLYLLTPNDTWIQKKKV